MTDGDFNEYVENNRTEFEIMFMESHIDSVDNSEYWNNRIFKNIENLAKSFVKDNEELFEDWILKRYTEIKTSGE